ncbi:acyl transferase/acyl hydrolase/lysophospholipase [Calycina marina]|uniref:Lysophospholipase n=1 Tax=Calycina marina TaxID=1763456 RepID=A0A9P7Z8A9_9HELO|nr:acyl transferase/acyl hydrolase/lysophospholipase [Calycina marina]
MKFSIAVASAALAVCGAIVIAKDASPQVLEAEVLAAAVKRALPNSPSGEYAPAVVTCPTTPPTVRSASSLSSEETAWLEKRKTAITAPMREFLVRMNITGLDTGAYLDKLNTTTMPTIGMAISGGGYRALLNGAGFLAAADDRTANSTNTGQIGGLLQSTTYLAGLSGGAWLVGSIYNNNFSSVQTLMDGSSGSDVWRFDRSVVEGPEESGISLFNTASYFSDIVDQVGTKVDAGFDSSITDYWGRALSYQLINATDGGPAYTWSSLALDTTFQAGGMPLPLLIADSRAPGKTVISLNSTLFEFNPWELGSWDPTTYAFAPLSYVGSNFTNGNISDNVCRQGYDQSGFVMGTSSSLFNQFLLNINSTSLNEFLKDAITDVLVDIGESDDDIATWYDLQNIPFNPLIQPFRNVDVIFAVDSSMDTDSQWCNGTALVATYERSLETISNGTAFPSIPDVNTMVNLGLNARPTFFGCDASNLTSPAPLVVYLPNSPYVALSNVSTYQLSYDEGQANAMIENGYVASTMGNGTLDENWTACVGCAILSRSFNRTGTTVPDICTQCFTNYCWDGTLNATTPSGYEPAAKLTVISTSGAPTFRVSSVSLALAAMAGILLS